VQIVRERFQEYLLGPVVPVGLLDGAAGSSDRWLHPAGRLCSLLAGRRVRLLAHGFRAQIGRPLIPGIFQNEGLSAVAYDNPVVTANLEFPHPPRSCCALTMIVGSGR